VKSHRFFIASIGVITPIGGLAALKILRGPVSGNSQYAPRKRVDRSQIQPGRKKSNSKLHSTIAAHSIQTTEDCGKRRNELSVIFICFGHVLRRTKALKNVIFGTLFLLDRLLNFWFSFDDTVTERGILSR
jgi:hypothetical protein